MEPLARPSSRRPTLIRTTQLIIAAVSIAAATGCSRSTAKLTPEAELRLTAEGVVRRADDLVFRRTHGLGTRRSGWEEMNASIIVTRRRVYIHQNAETLIEVEAGGRTRCRVSRDHDRLSLRLGSDRSGTSWSFHPPDDAAGWATDIRAALKAEASSDSSGD